MRLLLLPAIVALSACSMTPDLVRPAPPVPAVFPDTPRGDAPADGSDASDASHASHVSDIGWRAMFRDPRLQGLIERALANNRDLRLATLNVAAVQAQFRVQRAAQWPGVVAEHGMRRERSPRRDDALSAVVEQHGVGVGLSAFEIDLFGRMRALSDAAASRYLASDEGRRAAQIALVGAVASAYLAERLAYEQRCLAERTLADWRESLRLAHLLRQAHQNSGLDVTQATGQVADAEAAVEARQRALAQAGNALRLLVGAEPPAALPEALPLDAQPVLTRLPPGLPAALLHARPDIRQAEQALVAANADIGAARAAFFPRISLTASLGYASPALGALFQADHRLWRFSPQIAQPLFQGGRLRAELRLAEVRKSEAVAQYEQAIQIAFREVADGLAGSATYERQLDARTRAVASAERRMHLVHLHYRAGQYDRLALLDAQRRLYGERQALLNLRHAAFGNAVTLYKALGGGLIENMSSDDTPR
ncbi:MAG: efflux transporter outer membrane subunit [Janthinobacterium lividum]